MKNAIGLMALFALSQSALAGGMSTGGGSGAVCRDPNDHHVISAQLLDLYEGTINNQYTYGDETVSPQVAFQSALAQLSSDYYRALFNQSAVDIVSHFQYLPQGVAINVPPDLGTGSAIPVPEGCALEGVGYYNDAGDLQVSRSVYDALSNLDKAAFILHEAIYKVARETAGATDSALSRALNSELFATNPKVGDIAKLEVSNVFPNGVVMGPVYTPAYAAAAGQQDGHLRISFHPSDSTTPYLAFANCYDFNMIQIATVYMGGWTSGDAPISGMQTMELADNPYCFVVEVEALYTGSTSTVPIPFSFASADTTFFTAGPGDWVVFLAHGGSAPTIPPAQN